MRTLSPKIAFRNNLIHDVSGLSRYRNKLELYEKYRSDDLKIWAKNHLSLTADTANENNSVEGYYQFIAMLDDSLSYTAEKDVFQQLLDRLWSEKNFDTVLGLIKKMVLDYELFFAELTDGEQSALINKSLDIFTGFSLILDQYADEISRQFISSMQVFLGAGFTGDDEAISLPIHRAEDFTRITELNTKFIITRCRGPLTLQNLTPAYGSDDAKSFVDVYNKAGEAQAINRIYAPGAKIDLKDSSAYAEYIEVTYDEV